jgi:hypothetical protein
LISNDTLGTIVLVMGEALWLTVLAIVTAKDRLLTLLGLMLTVLCLGLRRHLKISD